MESIEQCREGFRTVPVDEGLKEQALNHLRQWLTHEEFAPYRPQIEWLIASRQWPGLVDRFYQILPFGTGGRRGAVGIGPNRMNAWTLSASVQGHCQYLKQRFADFKRLQVVLAYDVRQFEDCRKNYNPDLPNPVLHLSSRELARLAAGVYASNGIEAHILPPDSSRYLATPELSFTIRYLKAQGGLNVSASHNPPDDNGGKFYDERGGQPIAPDDQIMADLVDKVTTIKQLSWPEAAPSGKFHFLDDSPHQAYIDLVCHQGLVSAPRPGEINVVFTPLHGVGAMTVMETLVKQGFRITPVEAQMSPDGQFPNVTKTPNPEVPESMDKAAALAHQVGADLVISTDPDADRVGAMIPTREDVWRFLTGNEIASMLAYFKLSKLAERGELPPNPIVVKTEVTTNLITRITRSFNAQIVDGLLVGFKYIADVLWHLEKDGRYFDVRGTPADFVIGCEESHGILVTPNIRDKDAAGAALLLAELALEEKRKNRGLLEYLESLASKFGYFRNIGVPLVMTGILGRKQMTIMLDALRTHPPREIAGRAVTAFEDRRDETGPLGPVRGATDFAARNVLVFHLGDQARIILRPSGTEPKAKIYLEACTLPRSATDSSETWARTCREVDDLIDRMAKDFQALALARAG
jgi:phosphoglucomutase/phosphomannomutase